MLKTIKQIIAQREEEIKYYESLIDGSDEQIKFFKNVLQFKK